MVGRLSTVPTRHCVVGPAWKAGKMSTCRWPGICRWWRTRTMSALRFMVMMILTQAGWNAQASAAEPLTDATKIRALSREEAARALPVKLTGVVIYNGWYSLVLHDGKSSVFLDFEHAQKQGVWKGAFPDLRSIEPGIGVEVEGVTDPGGFSPMVLVA